MLDAIPCPHCGARMNRHAEKLVHGAEEGSSRDAGAGEVVVSVHECPRCGWIEQRREGPI